jgi:hypothetical protein
MFTCLYIILGFVILIAVWTACGWVHTRRLAASRSGENFATFRSSFEADEATPDVLWAVYAAFQRWCSDAVTEFPVRDTDDIGAIYGMVDDDLDDAVLEVLADCGRKLPFDEQLRRMRPIITVRDFALFVAACPEKDGSESLRGVRR